ncbi:MAG: arsR1 [Frankiales bacterium]|nr:arsR1 [Frankiales bacterium]
MHDEDVRAGDPEVAKACKGLFAKGSLRSYGPCMPPSRHAQVSDPRVLRALAHPLRGRLLGTLRTGGPSTATRLAGQLGESSGATSYHLRQLEAYGFVGEARRAGRERWWEALHQMTSWDPAELVEQPGGLEANEAMQRHQIEVMGRQLRAWADRGREHGTQWAGVAGLSDYVLRLTPEQTRACLDEVHAVLDRWSVQERPPSPTAVPVALHVATFPLVEPP